MSERTVSATILLPVDLLTAMDTLIEQGKAESRDELMSVALRHEVAAIERAAIDADLREMVSDPEYLAEATAIAAEFAHADWEAWQIGEREYAEGHDATR